MQKILIYDDNKEYCENLKKLIEQLKEFTCEISIAVTSDEAESFLESGDYTIVFLDIELENNKNGISFADKLQQRYNNISLVYITAHIKYSEDIFETDPDAFLLKPFTLKKVKRVIQIVERKQQADGTLTIYSGGKVVTVPLGNISYLENIRRRLNIFDSFGNCIGEYYGISLSNIKEQLPEYFLQCHQSIYVNMKQIISIRRFSLMLKCGVELPISQSRSKESRQRYIEFLGDEI